MYSFSKIPIYVDFKRSGNNLGVQISFEYGIDGFEELMSAIKACGGMWDKPSMRWIVTGPFAFYCVDILQGIKEFEVICSEYFQFYLKREMKRLERNIIASKATKPKKPIDIPVKPGESYFEFQKAAVEFFNERGPNILLTDDMGCISGDATINLNRGGKGFSISLRDAYKRFNGLDKANWNWNQNITTYARSLCGDELRLNKVNNIIYKGIKPVIRIVLDSGKSIKLTEDHELLMPTGKWVEAKNWSVGDKILTNGKPICPECGGPEDIITSDHAKFRGFCKSCVYKYYRKNGNGNFWIYSFIDKDGYVKVKCKNHPRSDRWGFVYQHVLIMEKTIGRYIDYDTEAVHHKNRMKHDNRDENLELVSIDDHRLMHSFEDRHHLRLREYFIPKVDTIASIESVGEMDVYDMVMDDPYRNFVANGIIVHNCGKTVEAIAIANYNRFNKVLIVCPDSAKDKVWGEAVAKWWVGEPTVRVASASRTWKDADIIIINYEIVGKFEKQIIASNFDFMIVDEAHNLKGISTKRTKALRSVAKKINAKAFLTGTPILNRPSELYSLLKILMGNAFGDQFSYSYRYCAGKLIQLEPEDPSTKKKAKTYLDDRGSSNLTELNFKLRSTIMMRREKTDVIDEFPNVSRKIFQIDSVDGAKSSIEYKAEVERYAAALAEIKGKRASFFDYKSYSKEIKKVQTYHFDKIAKIRYDLGISKIDEIAKFIGAIIAKGTNKIVLFIHHREVAEAIHEKFKTNSLILYGGLSSKEKARIVTQFEKDDNINIFIGSIKASGVAYTLTVSHTVVFGELDWTPSMIDQCECRCIRLGQKNDVNVLYLIVNNSLDLNMLRKINKKGKMIKTVMV